MPSLFLVLELQTQSVHPPVYRWTECLGYFLETSGRSWGYTLR